jgi:hypothetical protein
VDSENRSPTARQPYSSIDYTEERGSEEEFVARWNRLAEWMVDHPLGVRSMVLLEDARDPARFRSIVTWQTAEFDRSARLFGDGQTLSDDCRALCSSVEARYFLSAAHLYG